jgi:hypothetical protein
MAGHLGSGIFREDFERRMLRIVSEKGRLRMRPATDAEVTDIEVRYAFLRLAALVQGGAIAHVQQGGAIARTAAMVCYTEAR